MKTVKIGNLEWAAKNLDIVVPDSWDCNNDPANRKKYGRLYTWGAAKKAVETLGDGWRLPTDADWDDLVMAAGGKDVAGKILKSKRGWGRGYNGTNDFGFSALPGGTRWSDGSFDNVGDYGGWWTATQNDASYAWSRDMYYGSQNVFWLNYLKGSGLSLRCVRDAN